ncbi:MAG TPA: TetR/AcrR family transcriptional regulator [Solirubrobacterales bacterium]|nr:TetR/AcrR family transcriptional regulator [Solirubrobacterales bacterium]
MQKQSSSETLPNVLKLTVPSDIGVQSQSERMIDAMIASCAEKTYSETTIGDVVRGASISRTTFYKRFPDKRSCFDAALDHGIELVASTAAASRSSDDSPPEAVRKAAGAVLELLASQPDLARLLAVEAVAVDPAISGRYRALLLPAVEGLWNGDRPTEPRTSPSLAFGRGQLLIFNQVAAGRAEDLPDLLPEVVYLALAPFAGHQEALQQSRQVDEDSQPQPATPS